MRLAPGNDKRIHRHYSGIPDDQRAGIAKDVALGSFGAPEAIAETVWHAIENQYLTGAVISVDGGMAL